MIEYIFKGMTAYGKTLHATNDGYPACGVRGCCWVAASGKEKALPRCQRCERIVAQREKEAKADG